MKQIPINTIGGGKVANTILSGYYKFYFATLWRNYNGATAIVEINDAEDKGEQCERIL